MQDIKVELESIIFNVMLPHTQAFLDDLNEEIDSGNDEEEIIGAKKDMDSFIQELNQILNLIEEDKITDEEAQVIYEKIRAMLDEHKHEEDMNS